MVGGVVEIITDREWRRRWSREAKLRLAAEHAGVASLLAGTNTGSSADSGKAAIGQPAGHVGGERAPRPTGLMEVQLGNGRQVRVGSNVNLAASCFCQ